MQLRACHKKRSSHNLRLSQRCVPRYIHLKSQTHFRFVSTHKDAHQFHPSMKHQDYVHFRSNNLQPKTTQFKDHLTRTVTGKFPPIHSSSGAPLRRVAVTGMGMITSLGLGVSKNWNAMVSKQNGIRQIKWSQEHQDTYSAEELQNIPWQAAGQVDFEHLIQSNQLSPWVIKKFAGTSRFQQLGFIAAEEAINDAIKQGGVNSERFGVSVGAGVCSMDDIVSTHETLKTRGYKKTSAYFIPKMLTNLLAGHLSQQHNLQGPLTSPSLACATGSASLGHAASLIAHGFADFMLAGGSEAAVTPLSVVGFGRMRALSKQGISCPFDTSRDGFVVGEGAAMMVLEEMSSAERRGAKIYAELKGFGACGEAYHITAPEPSGRGASKAMKGALTGKFQLSANEFGPDWELDTDALDLLKDVGYINAHATSTPLGDEIEIAAITSVFGPRFENPENTSFNHLPLFVSSTKGAIGHTLGAAGAIEAVVAVKALEEGLVPPTLNLTNPISTPPFLNLPTSSIQTPLRATLSNSFGFGGINTSLLFTQPNG